MTDPTRFHSDILRELVTLEAAQHRPLRELLINPADSFARQRVLALDQQIAALRAELAAPPASGFEGASETGEAAA